MTEEEKQDTQKTVVAFIAGLLIGGLLVWVFGGNPESDSTMVDDTDNATEEVDSTDDNTRTNNSNRNNNETATSNDDNEDTSSAVPELPMGEGDVTVNDQAAGSVVALAGATFPTDEGWVGVRDYVDGEVTGLLGVARYSKEQGLIPEEVELLRATEAGSEYAIVFYSESGDREFDLRDDVPLGGVVTTFMAE